MRYIPGTGLALTTVPLLASLYILSSSSFLFFSSSSLSLLFASNLSLTPLSNNLLSSARALAAFPGVLPLSGIVFFVSPFPPEGTLLGTSNKARRACRFEALSIGFTVILSPADEAPFPGAGRRARADEVNVDVTFGLGWRMGLAAREAVWEMGTWLGRVRGR